MKYITEFRQKDVSANLARAIAQEVQPDRTYRVMEFCGGHTHAIFRYGVQDLMPANFEFIHGPGCPVCVLPIRRLDDAIELAENHDVILCSYGDMMRVPGTKQNSLLKAKARGADVRMVYSTLDALKIAADNPTKQVVFFAIGFETTTPPTAVAVKKAKEAGLSNFSVFSNHVLTPAAVGAILDTPGTPDEPPVELDGFLGPSHVSTIIGTRPYEAAAQRYKKPVVITGFEPLDVMMAALMIVRQINEGRHDVENQYTRVVTADGNKKAQALVAEVFELRDSFEWRGLGQIPNSALKLRDSFADYDAEKRFDIAPKQSREVKSCECPAILRGTKGPLDCKLFGKTCTPETPYGSCMVSSEGACAAYYSYGRFRADQSEGKVA
ncbi:hydrogenase formation protein HypD [Kordiimonas lipolytica]|uniref:Hydrogenase maturation factor n=1 Tax=Kordiimonas lipolytica TaxID=1662421 RepID=A0ABV8UCN0_9PROT|nr:hydrogenase formation protein HypD [Kordiimonas lipolytica]